MKILIDSDDEVLSSSDSGDDVKMTQQKFEALENHPEEENRKSTHPRGIESAETDNVNKELVEANSSLECKERIRVREKVLEAKRTEADNERKCMMALRKTEKEEDRGAREKNQQKLAKDKGQASTSGIKMSEVVFKEIHKHGEDDKEVVSNALLPFNHQRLPAHIWHEMIITNFSREDMSSFEGACKYFLEIARDPLFLLQDDAKPSHANDILILQKKTSTRILSQYRSHRVLCTHNLFLIGSIKGNLGLFNRKVFVIYNPYLTYYTKVSAPEPFLVPKLISISLYHNKFLIMICDTKVGKLYDCLGDKVWKEIHDLPDFLSLKPSEGDPCPTAIVQNIPYWSFLESDEVRYNHMSFKFVDCSFVLVPAFAFDKTPGVTKGSFTFVSFEDNYSVMVDTKKEILIHSLKESTWEFTYKIGWNCDGKLIQGFSWGGIVRHHAEGVEVYDKENLSCKTILEEYGRVYKAFQYSPTALLFEPRRIASYDKREKYGDPSRMIAELLNT